MNFEYILSKAKNGESLSKKELVHLLNYPAESIESYQVMATASQISRELSNNKAEVHAQLALNLAPCNCNCAFCSFAQINGVFKEEIEITPEQAITYARQFEADGANAIFIMATAQYSFGKYLEISKEIRKNLKPETVMIANVGDQSLNRARQIKDAGYAGVYHALRLREGIDTSLSPKVRKESIANFKEAGLNVGTCVEPVGPEHSNEELAEMILFTASFDPAYSGAARRIAIPGTELAKKGMITELRMAQIVAVTRLAMPRIVKGNCTHEPCAAGALAGANLFWAEVGANPRDVEAKTEEGRGETVESCRKIFEECNWGYLKGSSVFYL
jgi:biotin synthase